jgi:hypothetical protein
MDEQESGCVMELVDEDHNVYQCSLCRELWQFEADGPEENGWQFCPACGRGIRR